jgi:exonuclease SbcC
MLISKVEIENIKSSESATYEFEAGVTAISGPNGAGKTTILEAIAYALFDSLPYRKEDFLKRGTKKGSVRVTFVSALDGREYTVYRDTANGYYVFDPITKAKLVEQKTQVGSWIKEHLGVEPTTDLKMLFTSTIGVPQGTFTVDFSEQPAKRKIGFDKVLRVEEYQKASEEMRAAVKSVESKEAELNAEMARLEGDVAALDGCLAERARLEASAKLLQNEIHQAEIEQANFRLELERQEALKQNIERQIGELQKLSIRKETLDKSLADLKEEVRLCESAKAAVISSKEGFAQFNEANALLEELEPLILQRDTLKGTLAAREHEKIRVEANIESVKNSLQEIEANKRLLEDLRPSIEEQGRLETEKETLQKSITELLVLKRQEAEDESEIQRLRLEFQEVNSKIQEAEKLKEQAESVSTLEEERQECEAEFRKAEVSAERLKAKKKEAKGIADRITKFAVEMKTLEAELKTAEGADELAQALPQLESENQLLMEQVTELKLNIARENQILAEVKGGMCPLLSQKCLNMKEGEGLDQFFKAQLGNEQQRLAKLERSREELQQKVSAAKVAFQKVAALSAQRIQLFRVKQEHDVESKALLRVNKEIANISVNDKGIIALKMKLERIDKDLGEARIALRKFENLQTLKERLQDLKEAGQKKKSALDDLRIKLAAIEGLQDKLFEVEADLKRLDDPRGRSKQLELQLAKEPVLLNQLVTCESDEKRLQALIANLLKDLEAFSMLDVQLNTAREKKAGAFKDYQTYVTNEPLAANLEKRSLELEKVVEEAEACSVALNRLTADLASAQSLYDENRHTTLKVTLEESIRRLATFSSELNQANTRIKEISLEIERLTASLKALKKLTLEKDQLQKVGNVSDFIRDILKKAGPFITEAHLQSISIEANQLYREVTGNPMVSLRWDAGYEVVLEDEGHDRPFASLSGGEQMSAALSVRLALLKELSEIRIAFFDEPTTNMDEERRRNLAQQIGRIKDFNQLFVISHDDAFEGFTDRVITIGQEQ